MQMKIKIVRDDSWSDWIHVSKDTFNPTLTQKQNDLILYVKKKLI